MPNTQKVSKLRNFPTAADPDEVQRPYRLWDSKAKEEMRWAYFKNLRHAHSRALNEAAWARGDTTIELFDIRNGGLRGQYFRHGDQIKFWRSHHKVEET
jgi:hypothetical protein